MAATGLAVAPLGQCHPRRACWWCGAGLDVDGGQELIVVRMSQAYGWRCIDLSACGRRHAAAKQSGLF
jgi:hypothetical protein